MLCSFHLSALAPVAMAWLAACSSNEPSPTPPAPTPFAITVAPKNPSIVVGDTMQLSAVVRSSTSGFMNPPPPIDWFSRSPSVAQVDSVGHAWGVAGGSAWVVARVRSAPSLADSTHLAVAVLVSAPLK
jgi:Bacterial Ig-like domain (group 2)